MRRPDKANSKQLRKLIREECDKAGSQRAWALTNKVHPSTLSDVLAGRRDVTKRMAKAVGYTESREPRWVRLMRFED